MIVDCHAHMLPGELPDSSHPAHPRILRCDEGGTLTFGFGDLEYPAPPVWHETDLRLAAMDRAGVDVEVVSPMPMLLDYRLPLEDGLGLVRWVNERVAGLTIEGRGRIQGFGIVPLQDPDAAAAELRQLAALGLRGVEVASHVNGTSIGDARFRDFFAEADRLNLAVFVHAVYPPDHGRLPKRAASTFAFMTEAALAAASLVSDGTLAAYPDLRISVSHGAGGFPATLGRAEFFGTQQWLGHDEPPAAPLDLSDDPTPLELARRLYYDSLVFDTRALEFITLRLGSDRILLGSDFPSIPRTEPFASPLAEVAALARHLGPIAGTNALAFLAIEESGF